MILVVQTKAPVSVFGRGENVRRSLVLSLSVVKIGDLVSVDGEALVRIDGDQKETGIGLERVRVEKWSTVRR